VVAFGVTDDVEGRCHLDGLVMRGIYVLKVWTVEEMTLWSYRCRDGIELG
jgi:hypothetical protein